MNNDRDWTEDFEHENGRYLHNCIDCKLRFEGHKRRVICKTCAYRDMPIGPGEAADLRTVDGASDAARGAAGATQEEILILEEMTHEKYLAALRERDEALKVAAQTDEDAVELYKLSIRLNDALQASQVREKRLRDALDTLETKLALSGPGPWIDDIFEEMRPETQPTSTNAHPGPENPVAGL